MAPREVADGVWAVTAGSFPSNSYICVADTPGGAIMIDAGLDPAPIEAALDQLGLRPSHLFCTHGHFDHLGSASVFQKKYGASVHLHVADAKTARVNNFLMMAIKLGERIELPALTLVEDGFAQSFGDRVLAYRHTPGHTPGSCVISFESDLFSGDTVYSRGLGLSKLPGEKHDQLRVSILDLWPDLGGYMVHPGHGSSAPGRVIQQTNVALRKFLELGAEDDHAINARRVS